MIDEPDNCVVQRCLNGDRQAFECLVDKYSKTIFNTVYRMVGNYQDAEDITQCVFIKIYENLKSFKPTFKFFSWIYRIAINETLNFIQKQKVYEELSEEIASNIKSPSEIYDTEELNYQVQNALMALKEEYRIIIILKHFQNLSYQEIENILGIPEKKVKSRLFTARQMLKGILLREIS